MGMVWGRRLNPQNIEPARRRRARHDRRVRRARRRRAGPDRRPADRPRGAAEQFATTGHPPYRPTAGRAVTVLRAPVRRRRGATPAKLDLAGLRAIPVTVKADLIRQPADFLCADAPRHLATRTTGTTGRPAEIWLSRYEMELWPAHRRARRRAPRRLPARPTSCRSTSAPARPRSRQPRRRRLPPGRHAGCRLLGLVPPDEALDSLAEGSVTLLSTSPSYLGELVVAARRRGLGPRRLPPAPHRRRRRGAVAQPRPRPRPRPSASTASTTCSA